MVIGDETCEIVVAARLKRVQTGVRMSCAGSTGESLAEAVAAHIGSQVNSKDVPVDRAHNIVQFIDRILSKNMTAHKR